MSKFFTRILSILLSASLLVNPSLASVFSKSPISLRSEPSFAFAIEALTLHSDFDGAFWPLASRVRERVGRVIHIGSQVTPKDLIAEAVRSVEGDPAFAYQAAASVDVYSGLTQPVTPRAPTAVVHFVGSTPGSHEGLDEHITALLNNATRLLAAHAANPQAAHGSALSELRQLDHFSDEAVGHQLAAACLANLPADMSVAPPTDLGRFLIFEVVPHFHPKVISVVLSDLFAAFANSPDARTGSAPFTAILGVLQNVGPWNDAYLDDMQEQLWKQFKIQNQGPLRIPASFVPESLKGTALLQESSDQPGYYNLHELFAPAIEKIPEAALQQQLKKILQIARLDRASSSYILLELLEKHHSERIEQRLIAELQSKDLQDPFYLRALVFLEVHRGIPIDNLPENELAILVQRTLQGYEAAESARLKKDLLDVIKEVVNSEAGLRHGRQIVEDLGVRVETLEREIDAWTVLARFSPEKFELRLHSAMAEVESLLLVLMDFAKTAIRSRDTESAILAAAIIQIFSSMGTTTVSEKTHFQSELVSQLTPLAAEGNPFVLRLLLNMLGLTDDEAKPILELIREGSSEAIREQLRTLDQSVQGRRVAYLLLLGISQRPDLLENIVRDEHAPGEYRLYAFMHLGASDAPHLAGLAETLRPVAEIVIARRLNDRTGWVQELYDQPVLQDEEAKAYGIAEFLHGLRPSLMGNTKAMAQISRIIAGGKVVPYWNNANSAFRLGPVHTDEATDREANYFNTLAHEIEHMVVDHFIGFDGKVLSILAVHEVVADLKIFSFTKRFHLSLDEWMRLNAYADALKGVSDNEGTFQESHLGGRAQLELLYQTLNLMGIELDPDRAEEAWFDILVHPNATRAAFPDLVAAALRRYVELTLAGASAAKSTHDLTAQQGATGFFDVARSDFEQKLLPAEAIRAILAPLSSLSSAILTHDDTREAGRAAAPERAIQLKRAFGHRGWNNPLKPVPLNRITDRKEREYRYLNAAETVLVEAAHREYRALSPAEGVELWIQEFFAPRAEAHHFETPEQARNFASAHTRGNPDVLRATGEEIAHTHQVSLARRGGAPIRARAANARLHQRRNEENRLSRDVLTQTLGGKPASFEEIRNYVLTVNPYLQRQIAEVDYDLDTPYPIICDFSSIVMARLLATTFGDRVQIKFVSGSRYGLPHHWIELQAGPDRYFLSLSEGQFGFWRDMELVRLRDEHPLEFAHRYNELGYGRVALERIDSNSFYERHGILAAPEGTLNPRFNADDLTQLSDDVEKLMKQQAPLDAVYSNSRRLAPLEGPLDTAEQVRLFLCVGNSTVLEMMGRAALPELRRILGDPEWPSTYKVLAGFSAHTIAGKSPDAGNILGVMLAILGGSLTMGLFHQNGNGLAIMSLFSGLSLGLGSWVQAAAILFVGVLAHRLNPSLFDHHQMTLSDA